MSIMHSNIAPDITLCCRSNVFNAVKFNNVYTSCMQYFIIEHCLSLLSVKSFSMSELKIFSHMRQKYPFQ